jgi:hypothetical protein
VKLNINETCQVVLTAYGASVYNAYEKQFENLTYTTPNYKATGDTLKAQLWHLFQVFGDCIHMGMCEVPFEGNNIIIIGETV